MDKELIKNDLKRVPMLFCGLIILSIGIQLTRLAYIGLSPWSVFHDGVSIVSGLTFGNVTTLFGFIVLLISMILFKTKIGIGTILNMAIVGNLLNLFEFIYPTLPDNIHLRIVIFIIGVLLTTFGRSLYIASELGQGPRDGLFVGLSRVTNIDVKYVKPIIEGSVLIIGVVLGGNFGFGTIVLWGVSSYLVQIFFKLLGFNSKKKTQSDITKYVILKS